MQQDCNDSAAAAGADRQQLAQGTGWGGLFPSNPDKQFHLQAAFPGTGAFQKCCKVEPGAWSTMDVKQWTRRIMSQSSK